MLDAMAAAGKAHDTMSRVRALTSRILSFGVKRGRISRDVAALASVPAGPKAERRSLTPDEARRLLDAATGDRLEALYRTGLLLGLRPGELLGLTWQCVDLDAGVLTVAQALRQRPGGEPVLVQPKTRRSVRRLDLPPVLVDALRAHRKRQAAERLAAGALWNDIGLVFTTEVGRPIDPSNLRRAMRRLGLAAGVGHVHPHLLRQCTASLLSAAGVPLEDVADVLGHASPSVTGAIYRHPVRPTVSAGRDVMEGMFGTGAAR
jgi:integrase